MAGRVVAVVVTYNRLAQLQTTLARLLESPPEHLAGLVVIDNASRDGTGAWLAGQTDPRLIVRTSATNLGGAGGFAMGMETAMTQAAPDWLLLMDDDARPEPGTLAAFQAQDRGSHGGWAGAVYYPDGQICDMNRPWINPFGSLGALWQLARRGREGFHMGPADYAASQTRPIDGGSFVGLFLAGDVVARGGYPDPGLFLYGDDVLYTLGLSQAGTRFAFDPGLRFSHDCETLDAAGLLRPLWKVYFFYRNQVMVYRRAAGPVLFWPVLALKALMWLRRAWAYSGSERPVYLRLLRLALRDGLRRRTGRGLDEIRALSGD